MTAATLLVASILGSENARASSSNGGAFKSSAYGARAWGMGGAGLATISDEGAVHWNPAMLSLLPSNMAGASYINLIEGTTARQSQVAYAHIFKTSERDDFRGTVACHAVGAMFTNLHLGINEGVDANNNGKTNYDENIFRVAYAYSPDYFISFGFAGEIFMSTSDIPGFESVGSSIDAAMRLWLLENLSVGMVLRNAFSRYSYDDGQDFRRDREFAVGVSTKTIPRATVEADLVFAHGDLARAIIGGETDYFYNHLALRAGLAAINTGEGRSVPYLGFGVKFDRFKLHYNANLDDENAFGDTHRFSLSIAI